MTDHAAANETSITMALQPDLVHMEHLDSDPGVAPVAVDGSDPRTNASRERGELIMRMQEERMTAMLRDALR